jgi:hypothetical protein
MGGFGSGNTEIRWHTKTVVESCRILDANRWMRDGALKAGIWVVGSVDWWRDRECKEQEASIGIEVYTKNGEAPSVRLFYDLTKTGESLDYYIRLQSTRPPWGGLRWWFTCPLVAHGLACNRRVGKLYLPPAGRYFGCRRCHDLTYRSCQQNHKFSAKYHYEDLDSWLDRRFAKMMRGWKRSGK